MPQLLAQEAAPLPARPAAQPLLEVRDLKVHFPFRRGNFFRPERGFIRAVDGISFSVHEGETLGLVGESGCGKSTTAKAIVHLVQPTSGQSPLLSAACQACGGTIACGASPAARSAPSVTLRCP